MKTALVWIGLLLALLMASSSAFASFPASGGGQSGYRFGSYQSTCRVDVQAACDRVWTPDAGVLNVLGANYWACHRTNLSGPAYYSGTCTTDNICPVNSTMSGSTCTCSAGFDEVSGACVAVGPDAGKRLAQSISALGLQLVVDASHTGLEACHEGFVMSGSWSGISANDPSKKYIYGPFYSDGTACGPSNAETPVPATAAQVSAAVPPSPFVGCNGFPGYVDGVEKCIPQTASNGIQAISTVSSSESDATGTSTRAGSVVCEGNTCESTVVTTVTPTGGSATSTTVVKTESKADFCTANPKAGVCGDLVDDICKKNPERLECRTLDTPAGTVPTSSVNIDYGSVDVGIGAGSCPSPIQFSTVLGSTSINLATFCDKLSTVVRPVIIALGALMAFMIAWPRGSS